MDDEKEKNALLTQAQKKPPAQKPGEVNGPKGPEPTRYGDWESKGRCTDF